MSVPERVSPPPEARAAVPPGGDVAGPATDHPVVAAGPSRKLRTGLIVAPVLLAVAVTATLVARPGPVDGWLAGEPTTAPTVASSPEPTPTPVLAAANADAGVPPSSAAVTAALAPLVGGPALGAQVRISVRDAATGEALYERGPDVRTTPASTTKLVTAATVLAARGPAYRLTTRVVAGAQPGEVVLIGGGDPTLAVNGKAQFPGAARLDRLAGQVKKALGGAAPTRVLIDTSLFTGPETGPGWTAGVISPEGQVARIQSLMTNAGRIRPVHNEVGGDPRYRDPALAAGRAFAAQLGVSGPVRRATAPATVADPSAADPSAAPGAPAPGTELGRVQSPPLVHLVDWMLEQSDNVIAEALGRQVALAAGQPASFQAAAAAMLGKLAELGLPVAEAQLADASGLSRRNALTPSLLTDLLVLAAGGRQPVLSRVFSGLPVAGWSGTLRTRFATPAPNQVGRGIVRAKTGSLNGVNAISGALVTRDGRLLIFAILADRTGGTPAARQALDRIVARLAACGC
ncbi:D-alanyl-D-alanine carboxypeptidase/D-alanyl-D-alanine endopeptidase [Jidongwangia harbinensis]|uniref:D-alanyl-D-alanine carboxypeptidase/D-alanyl-D-alanine endopeptidase n=1 Tax=Jidongwangia harbinensis TaxID=2878561 RepID=UPI001CD944E1|nr:D-alanyl-D-alanine carboxypeptidase/D-alanyl-D-alanine-endopeptidase [Jidongwangia harbinensis]MCA2215856.1 D-alanyl-D-alanine carboxypeptidase/D-alanyl-D-alanine-endopeptidase [Jidongwangia harbinensis]